MVGLNNLKRNILLRDERDQLVSTLSRGKVGDSSRKCAWASSNDALPVGRFDWTSMMLEILSSNSSNITMYKKNDEDDNAQAYAPLFI